MPVTARGDKTDPFVVLPDWLISGRIRVVGIDFKGDQLLRNISARSFLGCRFVTDEVITRPVDPAVHAGHAGSAILGELGTPDAETLFQTQRVHCIKSKLPDVLFRASLEQDLSQGDVFSSAAVDLIAQFATDRNAGNPRTDKADVHRCASHEGQSGINILMGQG